ncbi:MAG: pyruvate ferredoxin oxidoreductase [Thermofilaceae archaeon]|nr:pyruvate ferredoxin oxidoreductase [Thermofilaceae archaeon]MCX8180075.1 pyruvate ferredoxin oxidoreductase [Thermofilaceae archaeon]MDW8004270.1 transketolase C-terminal domain-containing protein [Thermofilaceae archaeon]
MPRVVLSGNEAVAVGVKLSRVNVVAAYPITPQTTIVEKIADYVEQGELKARFINVESEHSAMAACIGAAAGGARCFTATSSQGLLYMGEMVYWAGGARLPIVMAVVNRALAPPWSIWCDHNDALSLRDAGWIQMWAESVQEVLDMMVLAYKVAENERVLLPVMVNLDGFLLSHAYEPVEVPTQETVDLFLPEKRPAPYWIDVVDPKSYGTIASPDTYMEFRFKLQAAMDEAARVIEEVDAEWSRMTGRSYGGLLELYKCEDAEVGLVVVGSWAGDAKEAIDRLREKGVRAGVIRLRVTRPFPSRSLASVAESMDAVAVVDRSLSPGLPSVLLSEVRNALYDNGKKPYVKGFIAGLGGRDVTPLDFEAAVESTLKAKEDGGSRVEWLGLKGGRDVC